MSRLRTLSLASTALAACALLLAACAPEPEGPTASPTRSATASTSPSPSSSGSATPTPSPSATSGDAIALPAACEQIYSPAMLASLTAQAPPLNDPGVTMLSTQNAELLEVLHSGIPTIRCSWGAPSEFGLATNVSIVDAAQAATVSSALQGAGFGCVAQSGGTICRIEQRTVDLDDNEVHFGETHFLRGNAWVSTAWINFTPAGYTEDIIATLWG
ncbi:hypothetical protein AAIB33_02885 [Microbacterium sp. AZCO]|uniref:hypothetical protein n=1 Tax=Microbacterium sp. AZCO TaxID=3142976 RepID=UPI0031F35F53